MNRTILTDTPLYQWNVEEAPDMLLLSELYQQQNDQTWIANANGRAAVWVPSSKLITRQERGQDYAWGTMANITFVSVYLPPNLTVGDFDTT